MEKFFAFQKSYLRNSYNFLGLRQSGSVCVLSLSDDAVLSNKEYKS
jgi:hypothetical protein